MYMDTVSPPLPVPQNSIPLPLFYVQWLSQRVFAVLSLSHPPPTQTSVWGGEVSIFIVVE